MDELIGRADLNKVVAMTSQILSTSLGIANGKGFLGRGPCQQPICDNTQNVDPMEQGGPCPQ